MGWVKGFEPSTPGTTIRCSNQLSYTHHVGSENGTPEGTRTPGLLLRRQLLYPAELLAHIKTALWGTHTRLCLQEPCQGSMERVKGIGPSYPAWKAGVLPLNYTRVCSKEVSFEIITFQTQVVNIFLTKLLWLFRCYARRDPRPGEDRRTKGNNGACSRRKWKSPRRGYSP